jgi:ABC-type multidrug transport system fused ATPase/permease subunit
MTHKIYWAERGLRYLYEVVTAELFMYTFCMIFMRQDPRFTDAIWIAGIFLLSYLIRDFAPNHILLTVGHLVLAGLLVILPGTVWIRTVTGIYDIGYLLPCAVAYAKRGSGLTDMSEPWPSILAGIFVYFASIGMELPVLSNLSYIAVALLMAIYMMIRYIQGLKRYISQTTEVSEQSIRDIAFINGRVVLFLAVLVLLLMGACRFLDLSGFVNVLARAFAKVVQTVFGAIMVIWVFVLTLLTKGGPAATSLDYQDTLNEYYQNSVKGYDVFTLILKVFVVLLLIFFLVRILLQVIRFLLKPRSYADDVIELIAEEPNQYKERITNRRIMHRLTAEEQARKIYKKSILRYKDVITLNKRMTCEDIRQEITETEVGNVEGISAIYEQIRYGAGEVDNYVIREMKAASVQNKRVNKKENKKGVVQK